MIKRRIYPLSGYPEEVIAVAFAKTSRSPEPFDKIAKELDEDKSRKFHEKWVVGYGHSSVAEHAVVHIAAENISRLAIEVIESCRLSSFTEKSTRYQIISRKQVFEPPELNEEERKLYNEALDVLFSTYEKSLNALIQYFEDKIDEKDEKKRKFKARVEAIDRARFLLPNATLANVGITVNARELEYMLVKLLSYPVSEVYDIGLEMKEVAKKVVPTLVKYANPNEYMIKTRKEFAHLSAKRKGSWDKRVRLLRYDKDAFKMIETALVFRNSGLDYSEAGRVVEEKGDIILSKSLKHLGKFDKPLREFEHAHFTFELIMDQGAYYEFKRHRMMTITPQDITTDLGYRMPEEFDFLGLKKDFEDAMKVSQKAFESIENKLVAGYVATNAHYRRVLATMNLRELYHFIRLRGSPAAHFTIREVANGMLDELLRIDNRFSFIKPREF